jgi:hypothetical protein
MAPDEPLIPETHYIYVNLNDRTFQLTEEGINHLRELDPSLD